jgi:hypothetical protein
MDARILEVVQVVLDRVAQAEVVLVEVAQEAQARVELFVEMAFQMGQEVVVLDLAAQVEVVLVAIVTVVVMK